MNPPPFIDVEEAFRKFVKSFGGTLISEVVGMSPKFANADYLFREAGVVAELKCLQKDVIPDHGCQELISAALERWIANGKIPPFAGRVQIQSSGLPSDCQRELFRILRRPLLTAIKKANKQIKETKINLNLPNAKGLLLLANDGCWSLEADAVLYLLDSGLGDFFEGINSVVFFTVNMPARMPGIREDALIWIPGRRKGIDPVEASFMSRLQKEWIAFYGALIGQFVSALENENIRVRDLRFIRRQPSASESRNLGSLRPPPGFEAGKFYIDSNGEKFRCIGLQDQSAILMRFEIHQGPNVLDVVFSQNMNYAYLYRPLSDLQEICRLEDRFRNLMDKRGGPK